MQDPVIGRSVYFWPFAHTQFNVIDPAQPLSAVVAFVHPGGTLVNLAVTDHQGRQGPALRVPFGDDKKNTDEAEDAGGYADWTPHQTALL